MAILIFLFCFNFAHASAGYQFKAISWDWIVIIALTTLFFLLLISLLYDLRNRKKELNRQLQKEKCKKSGEYHYLRGINKERRKSTQKLENSINRVGDNSNSKVIEELRHNYKALFSNNHEEKIFLDVVTNKVELKTTIFTIDSLLKEFNKYGSIDYEKENNEEFSIVADKDILLDVIFLLNQLQIKEGNTANSNFILNLESNNLKIDLTNRFKMNKNTSRVLNSGLKPIYSQKQKKYYGVYLYLIKTLLKKINGLLTLSSDEKSYQVGISLPVDIKYGSSEDKAAANKTLINSKKALILTSSESAQKISKSLEDINFTTQIESIKELNKEIPNFMEYDVVFMDKQLFEPILTEYLKSIKSLTNFNIIAIVNDKKDYYPAELVDATIEKCDSDEKLHNVIFSLYKDEVTDKSKLQEEQKSDLVPIKKSVKKQTGRVLVADDNRINRHILEYLIKSYGLEVISVSDGLEVLNAIEEKSFDLIILDSIMPNLDGYQTIVKIRKDSRFNATPVVIHTSFTLIKSSMENIFQLGFDSYLPKPFNKNELKALLDRYVQTKEDHTKLSKVKQHTVSKEEQDSTFKEFLAIYSESDRVIERYIRDGRNDQALALIGDLIKISSKVGAKEFVNVLKSIDENLKNNKKIESESIYSLSNNLQKLKSTIAQRLNA